ncbi:MAG: hypothetical protein HQL52_13400 [Magnetococcales bacterium]|nr:hypothetical protein [Magnetococcales bacterium]
MELGEYSRIGVVGGGPAGTFTAYFLLDLAKRLDLSPQVDIIEPRDFMDSGPKGCNMCGGIISESLVQMMATEGIHLPSEVILDTIDTYTLHTRAGSVDIQTPSQEMRIASIFRGGGPRGSETQMPLPWDSFDAFLLHLACCKGARHIQQRVVRLSREDGRPQVHTEDGQTRTYDLLVGAVGINGPGMRLFEELDFGYKPPKTTKAFIAEFYFGEEQVERLLGHAMHVFLLDMPGLKFAAMTPKGHYATFIILGDKIDRELVERVYAQPQVQRCMPPGWEIPVEPCHCQPRINIGPPVKPYGDRVVMVGDCGVSRLYKDGIGAAYRLGKICAFTALTHGVSAQHFEKHYWPSCRDMAWDNRLGHLFFDVDRHLLGHDAIRTAILNVIRREQNSPDKEPLLGGALWDTFTGSASYRNILARAGHPSVVMQLLTETIKSFFTSPKNGS